MKKILALLLVVLIISGYQQAQPTHLSQFKGLEPITVIDEIDVYDLVVQRQLACAEALEFVGKDDQFQYYLPCLKGSQMFFVTGEDVLNIFEALEAELISLEQLFEAKLVFRHPIEE